MSRKRKLDYTTNSSNECVEQDSSSLQSLKCFKNSSAPSNPNKTDGHVKVAVPSTSDSDIIDNDAVIKQLNVDLKKQEERLRKLKMVKMYREKNNLDELGNLIDKWRDVCQQALQDLQNLLPSPSPSMKELLNHLQIEYHLVHFDPEDESFS